MRFVFRPVAILALALIAPPCPTPAAEPAAHQLLDVDGVKLSYSVQGRGQPVLLIHGWLSSAAMNWDLPGITALLAQKYQVITYDVRGHGQSDKPETEDAYGPKLVEDVVRLLDHLHVKQVHVVGYSMGGILAANFTVKHSERVLSCTLGGMGWLKEGGAGQWGFAHIGRRESNAAAKALCGRSLAKLALTEAELRSIRVPVEVLVGQDDRHIQRLYVEPLRSVRTDWPIVEIPAANHFTCITRSEFRDALAAWLAKNSK